MTISMRVLPRFPARISATDGLGAVRDGTDIVIKQDWGSLIRIPAVDDPAKQYFVTWNVDQDLYSTMTFTDTFNAVIDTTGIMAAATYDPQDIEADAFDRANHTGTQAQSTIVNLVTDLAAKAPLASPGLTGNPTAPTQTAGDNSTKIATTAYADAGLKTTLGGSTQAKSADYTVLTSDKGSVINVDASGAARTITLPAAASAAAGFPITVKKSDSSGNAIIIDANASETIDGSSTHNLSTQNQSISLVCDGTGWRVIAGAGSITIATPKSATGSAVDFTGIPAGVKRIVVTVADVSTTGANTPVLQLGDSGGIETTGYNSINSVVVNAGATTIGSATTGFTFGAANAANIYIGKLVLDLVNPATNLWMCSGWVGASSVFSTMSGYKATSAMLDRVRLIVGGSDTYDAGTFNISWEF